MNSRPAPTGDPRIAHTLLRARDWQDRPQFEELRKWWSSSRGGLFALIGIGGAGKTAIVDRFLQSIEAEARHTQSPGQNRSRPPFVFSFYLAPNPDAFFAALAKWTRPKMASQRVARPADRTTDGTDDTNAAPSPKQPDPDQVYSHIQERLRKLDRCLLVLDGLEKVQDDGVRGTGLGSFSDARLRTFILDVARGDLPGVSIVTTTRFGLYDVEAHGGPLYQPVDVEELPLDAALSLLRRRGVDKGTDEDLKTLAQDHGCHALTIDLIGGYIAVYCGGDPSKLPALPDWKLDNDGDKERLDARIKRVRDQERQFARVATRYRDALATNDPAALSLLQHICLFRSGASLEMLRDARLALTERELGLKLRLLSEMHLVEATVGRGTTYTVHPAVRDGFLRSLDAEDRRERHAAVASQLTASLGGLPGNRPSNPEELDKIEENIHHYLAAGSAAAAWGLFHERLGGFHHLGWALAEYERGHRICRDFSARLPPKEAIAALNARAPTERIPLSRLSKRAQGDFFLTWGLFLTELGHLEWAVDCFSFHCRVARGQVRMDSASIGYANLANVYLLSGRLRLGREAAEKAVECARSSWLHLDRRVELQAKALGYLAHARALQGDVEQALADFKQCLKGQRAYDHARGPQNPRDEATITEDDYLFRSTARGLPLYSLRGIQYAQLLTRTGKYRQAKTAAEANQRILRANFGPNDNELPRCDLVLADLLCRQGKLDESERLLNGVEDWALARDAKELRCAALLVKCELLLKRHEEQAEQSSLVSSNRTHEGRDHLVEAQSAINTGVQLAAENDLRLHHLDLLLAEVRLRLLRGERMYDFELNVEQRVLRTTGASDDRASPDLFDEQSGYAWALSEAHHLRARVKLTRVTEILSRTSSQPSRDRKGLLPRRLQNAWRTFTSGSMTLPTEAISIIDAVKHDLQVCYLTRKKVHDPRMSQTQELLSQLEQGQLPRPPLALPRVSAERRPPPEPSVRYDYFLIHESASAASVGAARRLHALLSGNVSAFLDEGGTHAGDRWMNRLHEARRRSRHFVFLAPGRLVRSPWVEDEIYYAIDKSKATNNETKLFVVFVEGRPERDSILYGTSAYQSFDEAHGLEAIAAALIGEARRP